MSISLVDNLMSRFRRDPLVAVLLAVAALLACLSLCQLGTLAVHGTAPRVDIPKTTPPAEVQARVAADKSTAGSLKKKNLFTPPAPPRNPVTEVAGILGSEALINGQWYKTGAKIGDGANSAVVVAIEPTRVRVKWNGKETEFLPMNASGASSSSGPRPPEGGSVGPRGEGRRGTPAARSGGEGRGGSSSEMAAYAERLRTASSDEERQRIRDEMRQRRSGQ